MANYSISELQNFMADIPDFDYSKMGKDAKDKDTKDKEVSPTNTKQLHKITNLDNFSSTYLKLSKRASSLQLKLLMDVQVGVSAEIGRASIKVKDILQLEDGSIIKLNNYASEPINMLVDNIPIARGEVVVIDESFGIRLKEMLSKKE